MQDNRVCLCPPSSKRRYWTIPGGGIDKGETHADATVRESLEEVGILIKNIQPLNYSKVFMNTARAAQDGFPGGESHFYVADFSRNDHSLFDIAGDGRKYNWCTIDEARRVFDTDPFSEARLEAIYKAFAQRR